MNENITFEDKKPIDLFRQWLTEAEGKEPVNPNAMALATADSRGRPCVRMVLLKGIDERGFVFYTNSESRKGLELAENAYASLCFYWKSLGREVGIDGPVEKVSLEEADGYYDSRARGSQIGAWASKQSRPMAGRFELEKRVAQFTAKFHVGKVPRPEFWEGYRVKPERIEFWAERRFRLHDRIVYIREVESEGVSGSEWEIQRLFP